MPLFCVNFDLISNSFFVTSYFIYIFLLNNFILSYSVLCWWLQCQHSCQYFVWTLILFLISFSVTSFSISIFLFNNFILYYFCCCVDYCNVNTRANILFVGWGVVGRGSFTITLPGKMSLDSLHLLDGPRNLHLKFGQNRISNSWDISEMNKCHQDKFCLGKCHCYSRNLLKMVPGTYLQSLVEIGSVTAEIQDWWHTPNAERRNTSNYYIDTSL